MAKKKKAKLVDKHKAAGKRKLKYCPHCKHSHYKSVHKMHGKGSYKKSRSVGNIRRATKARR